MAHKPKIDQHFAPSKVTLRGISSQAITRRQIELESCSNPPKTREGMQLEMKKKLFSLGCLFFFNAFMMIECLFFFADISIFARPPFKTRRSHLNDIIFFYLAVFWLLFGTFKGSNRFLAFLVPRLGPKNIKIKQVNPPKVLRKAPYQLAVFWPNFSTRNVGNSIKGSKNPYSHLKS